MALSVIRDSPAAAATSVLVNGDQTWAVGASGFPLGVSINADFMGNQSDGVLVATSRYQRRSRRLNVVLTTICGNEGVELARVVTKHLAAK